MEVVRGTRMWCVVHGDCLELMRCLPSDVVHHVITDPPYSPEVHARSIRRTTLPDTKEQPCRRTRKFDFGFDHLSPQVQSEAAMHFARLAKRWTLVFCDMELAESWRKTLSGHGLDYIRTGVWVKDRSMPQISGDRPGSRAELVVICHQPGRKKWNSGGDGNVWQYPVVVNCNGHRQDRVHTAQKPIELLLEQIEQFTDRDEVILDPFCGSGTTGVAALRTGRRAILVEQDEKYADIARARVIAEENGSSLPEHLAGQQPLFGERFT